MSLLRVTGNGGNRLRTIDESIRRCAAPTRLTVDTNGVLILVVVAADNRFER